MCKCDKCGKTGKFFNGKENWYILPWGVFPITVCDECFRKVMEEKK